MSDADLAFAGAARQAELIRAGETSSRALVQLYLDRIARHDPEVNAYRVVFAERALEEAEAADARKDGGPLNGVPIAVKDDTDVKGEITAKGTIAHGGVRARVDAKIVRRLREAGAVILGKTNVPELMALPFTETLWYGATRNPWDLDRTPGGSSGGSGAAVAAGLCAAATGSDGAGSIRIPSACCGLVGLKPAQGVVPTPPSWRGLSTYGFLARTVEDARLLLEVATGEACEAPAPEGLKVAWSIKVPLGSRGHADAVMRGAVDSMVDTLSGLGHDVFRRDPDIGPAGFHVVARYLRGIAEDARTLPDRSRLDGRSKGLARLGALVPDAVVDHADRAAGADRERYGRIFDDADVLLTPVFTELPPRIGDYASLNALRTLDKELAYAPYAALANHMELPAIAVPTDATHDGFPLAVQLVGPQGSEARLLALAAQLEHAVGWADRRPTGFD
jgi:amidase